MPASRVSTRRRLASPGRCRVSRCSGTRVPTATRRHPPRRKPQRASGFRGPPGLREPHRITPSDGLRVCGSGVRRQPRCSSEVKTELADHMLVGWTRHETRQLGVRPAPGLPRGAWSERGGTADDAMVGGLCWPSFSAVYQGRRGKPPPPLPLGPPPKPYLHPLGDKGTLYNPPSARHRYEINPASITNRGEPAYKQTSPPPRQNSAALPTTRHHAVRSTRYQSETNLLSTAGDPTRWRTGTSTPR